MDCRRRRCIIYEICPRRKKSILGLLLLITLLSFSYLMCLRYLSAQWRNQHLSRSVGSSRKFPTSEIKFRNRNIHEVPNRVLTPKHSCKFWAVLRTISEPSEAVRRFLYLDKWCVVIVGDTNSPKRYQIPTSLSRNFVFLDPDGQLEMDSPFIQSLPWNSFSRKNIGYLYAISQGASIIWDFDDNSMLKFWIDGAAVDKNLWIETFITENKGQSTLNISKVVGDNMDLFFNPHVYLGSPFSHSYPRGFPLNKTNRSLEQRFLFRNEALTMTKAGVLQSLADHEPDVYSLSGMENNTPFYFSKKKASVQQLVVMPHGLYTPMNSHATLHFRRAFFALYLPHTVNEAESDILRSYIAQTLFSFCDLYVGFLPRPLVDRVRKPHSNTAEDLIQETPLFAQIIDLVAFLDEWRKFKITNKEHLKRSLEDLMEELYIRLYERGFVGRADVFGVQRWLEAVVAVGYKIGQPLDNRDKHSRSFFNIGHSALYQPHGMPHQCSHPDVKKKQAIFWTSDLHDGVRLDTPSLLATLGQKTYVAGIKGSKTPYPGVFQQPLIKIYRNLSKEILAYRTSSHPLNNSVIERNAAFFRKNPVFQTVDAFFCSFPASMCELWMPFNKTKSIIFLPAHRYNLGRCSIESWMNLNTKLKELDEQNRQAPKSFHHVIAAASRYDFEYLKYYTDLQNIQLLTSFSGFYTNNHTYNPTQKEVLVLARAPRFLWSLKKITSFKTIDLREKYKRYTLDNLTSHRAIIFCPYSVMSFKFTEFYSLNIPLFVPSAKYFRLHAHFGADRTSTTYPYCNRDPNLSRKMKKAPSSTHSFNPNTEFKENPEHELYWLQFSDFYDWPHVQYFDNREDLERKFANSDFMSIHKNMKRENEIRKYGLLEKWCKIIQKINHQI